MIMKNKKVVSKDNEKKGKPNMDIETDNLNDTVTSEFPCDDTAKDTLIAEQKAKIEELNDKHLRLYAEFDNYRKRTTKERIEQSKNAAADVIVSFLPVLDDYERAISAIPDEESTKAIKEGIILIYNKYKGILTKNGLEEIKSLGEVFNTDLHEAIANVPAENNEQKGKIVDLVEKGYYLNGVVIRFAKVVVAN
jgi:molecular chaperone GrpE